MEALLDQLFSQETRLLDLRLASGCRVASGRLAVHRLRGWEAVNEGFRYEVEVLSGDAFLALKDLEGVPIGLTILTARGTRRALSGVITGVSSEGTDGGLALYRLVVEPVTAALALGRGSRVFLGKSYVEVALQILQEQLQSNPVFGASFSIQNLCRQTFPTREFIFMRDETPWDFVRRCLAREGVSFVFEPVEDTEAPRHRIVLFQDGRDLPRSEAGFVRFHRADGTEEADAITTWHARRVLQVGQVARRGWDHRSGSLSTTGEELRAEQGEFGDRLASTLEDYHPETPLEHDDVQAFEAATARLAQLHESRAKSFAGEGTVRDFRAGTSFTLEDHPVQDRGDCEFLLTRVELEAENNLPKDAERGGQVYRNRFVCQRVGIPLLPEELPFRTFGLLTATVVGPGDEPVHTDPAGRIRIRLHVTRTDDHPEAGASGTDKDSFWVRLLQPWSSAGMGGTMVPRVGDEVLVSALNDDPDKLVILGVLPGGARKPARFSEASDLPADKALSGFRSREFRGWRGNQLLFDDTPSELRTHLSSDHAASELNLGFLTHPRKGGTAQPRGEGAELRTDGTAVVRGAGGVYLSADARPRASGSQLSREEALGHLKAGHELAKTLGDLGTRHGADPLEAAPQADLLKAMEDWEKGTNTDPKNTGGKRPLLVGSAPAGLALTSGAEATVHSASNLDLVGMRNVQVGAGKGLFLHALEAIGLFAHRLGMKLIAASGDITIQAQDGLAELIAAKVVRLMSVGGKIELDAKAGIVLRSGGAFLEIKDGGITAGGPGAWKGQFSGSSWPGPASQQAMTQAFGASEPKMDEFFRIYDKAGDPIAHRPYEITKEDGSVIRGVTDGSGLTQLVTGKSPEKLLVRIFPETGKE